MSNQQSSIWPLKASAASTAQDDVIDSAVLFETNAALFCLYLSFVMYLLIPRGARKHFCNAYPKRYAKTFYVKHEVPTHISTYESISEIGGCVSSPSALSRKGCAAPLILDPRRVTCVMGTGDDATVYSSPSRAVFRSSRHHNTPLPLRIDEDTSQSPNSVLDQSIISDSKKLLVLISSRCLDKQQEQDQKDAMELLRKRRVPFATVDGMDGAQRSRRNELYELSGIRAQYPQFFFVYNEDGRTTYLGDWKTLQKIHHAEGLPRGYRDANPTVSTWNQIFCDTSQIFSV